MRSTSSFGTFLVFAIAVLAVATGPQGSFAQGFDTVPETRPNSQANVSLVGGFPLGAFGSNVSNGYGFKARYAQWIGEESPVQIGIDGHYIMYGSTETPFRFGGFPSRAVGLSLSTNNYTTGLYLSTRLQEQFGGFRPYIEALGGFKYLFTYTSINSDTRFDNRSLAGDTNFGSFALSGGVGAGIDITVAKEASSSIQLVEINLGVQYFRGGSADYLTEGRLVDENQNGRLDRSELSTKQSATNHIQPSFGVTFRLK